MTSKNLFFNLIKEDLKRRLWVPALTFVVFFFTFPVGIALMISDYTEEYMASLIGDGVAAGSWAHEAVKLEFLSRFESWVSFQNAFIVVLVILFSVICAVSGFSYLHSKVKTDFYHSVPVSREKLFASFFTGGVLFMAVPYAVNLLAASVIAQVKLGGLMPWGMVIQSFLVNMAFFLLMYATVLLAVVLTGNLIVSLLGTGVFFAWMPILGALIYSYHESYFNTFYNAGFKLNSYMVKISPVTYYTYSATAGLEIWVKAGIALTFAAMMTAVVLFLYRIRPSESAGKAMAFGKSCPVIKFILVVPLALFASLVFKEMKDSGLWSIFGLVCGLLLSYGVIEIIYNFDFRKMFSHKLQLLICGGAAAVILGYFSFDMGGYDTYLPSEEKVETVSIYSFYLDNNTEYNYYKKPVIRDRSGHQYIEFEYGSPLVVVENMRLNNTADILSIAKQGVGLLQKQKEGLVVHVADTDEYQYRAIQVGFHLKNGKTVYRSYWVNMLEIEDELASVYGQKEYKEIVYPILNTKSSEISGINYQELDDYRHVNLPDASMIDKLLSTYQEELSVLTAQTRKVESPIAALQFKTHEMQEMIDILRKNKGDYQSFNHVYYYPIYPSFTKTIELLNTCGIKAGSSLTAEKVDKIELLAHSKSRESMSAQAVGETAAVALEQPNALIVKDKAEIAELLDAVIYPSYGGNDLNPMCQDIEVSVYVRIEKKAESGAGQYRDKYGNENAEYDIYRMQLDKDRVPEFVKKGLNTDF